MDRTLSLVLTAAGIAAVAGVTTSTDRTASDELGREAGASVLGQSADSTGRVYVVHGAPGRHLDVEIDGTWLARLGSAEVAGPYALDAGQSTVRLIDPEGDQVTSSTIDVVQDGSSDVVVHWPAGGGSERTITVFDNDLSPITADKTSFTVANTAALPPADVMIDDEVLFAQMANGEFLDLVMPEGTYAAQIAPTKTQKPVLLPPQEVTLAGGTSHRMYAIGDPRDGTLTFASHVLDAPATGSPLPDKVNTGTGGLFHSGVTGGAASESEAPKSEVPRDVGGR